jgi:hypothetical protein
MSLILIVNIASNKIQLISQSTNVLYLLLVPEETKSNEDSSKFLFNKRDKNN